MVFGSLPRMHCLCYASSGGGVGLIPKFQIDAYDAIVNRSCGSISSAKYHDRANLGRKYTQQAFWVLRRGTREE